MYPHTRHMGEDFLSQHALRFRGLGRAKDYRFSGTLTRCIRTSDTMKHQHSSELCPAIPIFDLCSAKARVLSLCFGSGFANAPLRGLFVSDLMKPQVHQCLDTVHWFIVRITRPIRSLKSTLLVIHDPFSNPSSQSFPFVLPLEHSRHVLISLFCFHYIFFPCAFLSQGA